MNRKPQPHDLLVALLLVQSLLERRSEAFFAPFGLTGAQFNILNLLARHGGEMDQGELGEQLLVGKSSISIVLNRMAKAGLIRRKDHPQDRRRTVLLLTLKARLLWKKISPRYEAIVKEVFGAVPGGRRAGFMEDLKAINDALLAGGESGRWVADFATRSKP